MEMRPIYQDDILEGYGTPYRADFSVHWKRALALEITYRIDYAISGGYGKLPPSCRPIFNS